MYSKNVNILDMGILDPRKLDAYLSEKPVKSKPFLAIGKIGRLGLDAVIELERRRIHTNQVEVALAQDQGRTNRDRVGGAYTHGLIMDRLGDILNPNAVATRSSLSSSIKNGAVEYLPSPVLRLIKAIF